MTVFAHSIFKIAILAQNSLKFTEIAPISKTFTISAHSGFFPVGRQSETTRRRELIGQFRQKDGFGRNYSRRRFICAMHDGGASDAASSMLVRRTLCIDRFDPLAFDIRKHFNRLSIHFLVVLWCWPCDSFAPFALRGFFSAAERMRAFLGRPRRFVSCGGFIPSSAKSLMSMGVMNPTYVARNASRVRSGATKR